MSDDDNAAPTGMVIRDPGLHATVQDAGRDAARRWGVPRSGALDMATLAITNALVGNAPHVAAIEMLHTGANVEVTARARVALGSFDGWLEVDPIGRVPAWTAVDLEDGDRVRIVPSPTAAASYLAVAGGFAVPEVLGSASTYIAGGFGGHGGRCLRAGDVLPFRQSAPPRDALAALPYRPVSDHRPLRVVPGPQLDAFALEALSVLTRESYTVSGDASRMGLRLAGPALAWADDSREMISDSVLPGALQVPSNGMPILLLADCQTTGGYPKIAVVCTADLARAGQLRPGDVVRFESVTVEEAEEAYRRSDTELARRVAAARTGRSTRPDVRLLQAANLVSGVYDLGAG